LDYNNIMRGNGYSDIEAALKDLKNHNLDYSYVFIVFQLLVFKILENRIDPLNSMLLKNLFFESGTRNRVVLNSILLKNHF
jgi:hypothetical protein